MGNLNCVTCNEPLRGSTLTFSQKSIQSPENKEQGFYDTGTLNPAHNVPRNSSNAKVKLSVDKGSVGPRVHNSCMTLNKHIIEETKTSKTPKAAAKEELKPPTFRGSLSRQKSLTEATSYRDQVFPFREESGKRSGSLHIYGPGDGDMSSGLNSPIGEKYSIPYEPGFLVLERSTSLLNDYTILSLIGKGAYGKVKKIKHKETGAIFALKQIRKSYCVRNSNLQAEVDILKMLVCT